MSTHVNIVLWRCESVLITNYSDPLLHSIFNFGNISVNQEQILIQIQIPNKTVCNQEQIQIQIQILIPFIDP